MSTPTSPVTSAVNDPITMEVIKDAFVAIGDEMFVALGRTAMSPLIYETRDYACGILNARGELLAQGNGITGFLKVLSYAVEHVLRKFGPQRLEAGDVLIVNDPYEGGGSHLSDVVLVAPIYVAGQLVGFTASKAHWTDVGGADPGSTSSRSRSVFEEGIQLPCVKLFRAGVIDDGVIDILLANTRLPEIVMGDMRAQAASLQLGTVRYQELAERHGVEAVLAAGEYMLDYGERITKVELAKLPAGTYSAVDSVDDDGQGNGPTRVAVSVTISPTEFIADFTGTDPQTLGAVNCTLPTLVASVAIVMKAITGPDIAVNDGCFRPMTVICPEGTVLTAQRPAPTSVYFEAGDVAMDVVWRALAEVVPHRLSAGHFLSVCGTKLALTTPDDPGQLALLVEPQPGGWGATGLTDGEHGVFCAGDGETYVVPIEVAEAKYNIVVEQFSLNIDDAGAGRFRGGRGCIREYRALGPTTFGSSFGRHSDRPWGVDGGMDGSSNRAEIHYADGRVDSYGKSAGVGLTAGDRMRLVTGTGAGWGDPRERPVEAVVSDVREGYVTREQAAQEYGVVVDSDGLSGRRIAPGSP